MFIKACPKHAFLLAIDKIFDICYSGIIKSANIGAFQAILNKVLTFFKQYAKLDC